MKSCLCLSFTFYSIITKISCYNTPIALLLVGTCTKWCDWRLWKIRQSYLFQARGDLWILGTGVLLRKTRKKTYRHLWWAVLIYYWYQYFIYIRVLVCLEFEFPYFVSPSASELQMCGSIVVYGIDNDLHFWSNCTGKRLTLRTIPATRFESINYNDTI